MDAMTRNSYFNSLRKKFNLPRVFFEDLFTYLKIKQGFTLEEFSILFNQADYRYLNIELYKLISDDEIKDLLRHSQMKTLRDQLNSGDRSGGSGGPNYPKDESSGGGSGGGLGQVLRSKCLFVYAPEALEQLIKNNYEGHSL